MWLILDAVNIEMDKTNAMYNKKYSPTFINLVHQNHDFFTHH
jgi:hypothetical protein